MPAAVILANTYHGDALALCAALLLVSTLLIYRGS